MISIIAKSILLGGSLELILNESQLQTVNARLGNFLDILKSGETNLGQHITVRLRKDLSYERILELKVMCFEEELADVKSQRD